MVGALAAPAAMVLALVLFGTGLGEVAGGRAQEDRRQLEDVLRRATVACYAADGVYPADLGELVARCGVQIDGERYLVRYEPVAANLMPDITVLELGK